VKSPDFVNYREIALYLCSVRVSMKLIDYDRYTKYWSLRNWVICLVAEAIFTGLCAGMTVFPAPHEVVFTRIIFLVLAVSGGLGTLQATLIVLHNCPPVVKTGQGQAISPLAH
jgi:hypothetical protein